MLYYIPSQIELLKLTRDLHIENKWYNNAFGTASPILFHSFNIPSQHKYNLSRRRGMFILPLITYFTSSLILARMGMGGYTNVRAMPETAMQFGNDFESRGNYTKTPFILRVDKPLRNRSHRRQVVYASVGYVTTPIASFGKCLVSPCFTTK